MAKKHGRGGGRQTPNRSATRRGSTPRHHSTPEIGVEAQPLVRTLREALRNPNPIVFLVSGGMVAQVALDPDQQEPAFPGAATFLDSVLEVDIAEFTAVLHLIAAFTHDDLLRHRIDRELAGRRQPVPPMVRGLRDARAHDAWFMGDELGDGDNVIVGVRWPTGEEATVVTFVDHNLGTIAKDVFVIDEPIAQVMDRYRMLLAEHADRGSDPVPMGLADARARIEQAVERLDASGWDPAQARRHPDEPTMWPQCRPLLEHVLSTMPPGGDTYDVRPLLTDDELAEFDEAASDAFHAAVNAFIISDAARPFIPADPQTETDAFNAFMMATTGMIRFAIDQAGDPLRWTPVTVEIYLTRGLAMDLAMTDAALDLVPTLLPALIRWCHAEAGISAAATAETLDTVAAFIGGVDLIRDDPGLRSLREDFALFGNPATSGIALTRRLLEDAVGGADALAGLDAAPLPDEPLDLSGVPVDVHDTVREVSALIDGLVDDGSVQGGAVFDVEFRTACRRFLVRAASADPAAFRRRAKPANTAAAIAWMVARANELAGYPPAPVRTGALLEFFGAGSVTSRADTLRRAFGGRESLLASVEALASVDVLTGPMRARLIARRDAGTWNA